MSSKSFIILNQTKALSLSPDSGTDYGPFSASSSISPPFLSSTLNFPAERDVIGAERETFAAERFESTFDRVAEREVFAAERHDHVAERQDFTAERHDLTAERFDNISDRFDRVAEREVFKTERHDHAVERLDLTAERLDSISEKFDRVAEREVFSADRLERFENPFDREVFSAERFNLAAERRSENFHTFKFPSFSLPFSTTSPSPVTPNLATSVRRLSGITITSTSVASLAKSTPSISTDLYNERPLSFTVLPNNNFDTYQTQPVQQKPTLSCSSLASFSTWTPITTTAAAVVPSTISSMLSSNRHSFGPDPSAIKPIISALEQIPVKATVVVPIESRPKPVMKKDSSDNFKKTLERYNKFVEKQKMQLELQQQQQADFLSLSLSPPVNRRNKEMLALRGSFVSL